MAQIGTDRVIEITFGDGQYRLFLEFFAAGNIIVTDKELNVLALQRQVSEDNEDVDIKLGGKYLLEPKQNFHGVPPVTPERAREALATASQRTKAANEIGGKKAKRSKGGDTLRKALSATFTEFPPHLLDHAFKVTGVDPDTKAEDALANQETLGLIVEALHRADTVFKNLDGGERKGYIIAKSKTPTQSIDGSSDAQAPPRESLLYDDFHSFRPSQFENQPGICILEFEGFNRTVDEFYSSIESQRLESRLTEREEIARKKLQSARDEHSKRIGALQQVQELHIRKAQAIEANTHRVEEACAAVNGLIGQGMDWVDIGKLIENEQKRGNIVAQMVKVPLKLDENTVTLLLDEPGLDDEESDDDDTTDDERDSDEEGGSPANKAVSDRRLAIDIDLALSPWANARQYYDQKKSAAVKEQKTMEASTKALQSAQKKIGADLTRGLKQEKTALRPSRKQFWFEKFLFFISSDGYLVIGGKDSQQNELLYRRYLKKGDIYVHADLQGASTVIVKNNPRTPDAPIPPSTLSQAGAMTVCTSSAWDSKALMGAWWVNPDQVSKTTPTGEYLTTGGFVIRGRKNLLPPSQLLLGFGVMWLISEESRANHGKHRLERTESMLPGEADALENDVKGLSLDDEEFSEAESSDDQQGQVPVDVEDAANNAEEEEKEDAHAIGADETRDVDHQEDNDGDEDGSVAASETEDRRSNPLQNWNDSRGQAPDTQGDEPEAEVEIDSDHSDDEHDEESLANTPDGESSTRPSTPALAPANPQAQPKQRRLARGKRTKAKRAQKKYAEQDEEDRVLAMQLLGSERGQDRKKAMEEEKAAREAKAQADRERRKAQHAQAAEKERLRHERLEKAAAEGTHVLDENDEQSKEQLEQERRELLDIDRLVPVPQPGDELMAAIPVVAPWTAMTRQKYKIKLQPGGMKKGKAIKEILGFWTGLDKKGPKVVDEANRDKERAWRRELDLLKEWRMEEVVGYVPVKGCRIVQGGGMGGGSGAKGKGSAGGGKGKGKGGGGKKGR